MIAWRRCRAIGWVRRLAAHPVIGRALAAGELSPSWARRICEWTDRLPEAQRGDADEILAGTARGGAGFADLAGLAQEMYERSCREAGPRAEDDRFEERWFRLGIAGAFVHHQIAVHRQGWDLRLNSDGTTTATSPDRTRTLHSHSSPPSQAG